MVPVPDLGADTVLCEEQQLVLDAGTPAAEHIWSTGATAPTIVVHAAGVYSVRSSNGPCVGRDTVQVEVVPLPRVALPVQVETCLEAPPFHVLLDAGTEQEGHAYVWTDPSGQQTVGGPVYEADVPGAWSLRVTGPNGCAADGATLVSSICPGTLYVPNSFTPDGDGVNDVFRPVGERIDELELFIFDRWGELLVHAQWPDAQWDGTYAGEDAQDGVYTWRIRYRMVHHGASRAEQRDLFGHVTLLR